MTVRPLHIGIVGCSAEGAALCYRTVCLEGASFCGPHDHPEVSMHTLSLARYMKALERGNLEGVADLMLLSAHKLFAAGAELLICPDNTIHQAFPWVAPQSPLPWLHIAEVVAEEAQSRGFKRLGLTGTTWLIQSNVYPEALAKRGLEVVRPSDPERDEISRIIMDELVWGRFLPASVGFLQAVIGRLQKEACDAVILGCTEIPLIIHDAISPLPTLDSTRLLARAALKAAVGRQSLRG